MNRRFFTGWFLIYALNAFSGYLVHHVLLGSTYQAIAHTLHADVKSRLWAFILISIIGSFFFTLFFAQLKRFHSITGGLLYGLLIGVWLTTGEYFSAYASSDAIPLTLAIEWIILGIIQYIIAGCVLGLLYNEVKGALQKNDRR